MGDAMKTKNASIVALLLVPLLCTLAVYFALCVFPGPTQCNYGRVSTGMTLSDVEAILGPGDEIPPGAVPVHARDKRGNIEFVTGDRFFQWPKGRGPFMAGGRQIIIGMRNDRVCDKWWHD
jgi:hypothetical protein